MLTSDTGADVEGAPVAVVGGASAWVLDPLPNPNQPPPWDVLEVGAGAGAEEVTLWGTEALPVVGTGA